MTQVLTDYGPSTLPRNQDLTVEKPIEDTTP